MGDDCEAPAVADLVGEICPLHYSGAQQGAMSGEKGSKHARFRYFYYQ